MKANIKKYGMFLGMLMTFISSMAYDFEADGIYYTITSMADLEVEVTSNGNFEEVYVNYSWSWKNTTPYAGHISIPATVNYNNRTFEVTGIGKAAFGYPQQKYSGQINYFDADENGIPTSITSVSLPATIKYIDVMAFQGCKIQSINIPSSVTTIDIAAFAYSSLQNILIPNSVTHIGKSAFYGSSIMSLCLGNGINEISDEAFSNCSSLLEAFCTSPTCPSGLSVNSFLGAHSALEIYVPSVEAYGFGRSYLTFPNSSYDYTGQSHNIEWTNNLKAYKCEIAESECLTEVNAGEYTKTLTVTYSNGIDLTVDIPYSYTINKAPMFLTVNNAQREYGDPNPAFTCEISGFVNGETEQTLGTTPLFECAATQLSNVGDYRILASLDAHNYEISYKYGTLSVIKAPLEATVLNTSKIYGNDNPAFSLSFSGLKNNESTPEWSQIPQFSTSATVSSSVGQYEVTAAEGMAVNYDVTKYNSGTLTVTKRDLTAKANDCERLYNEENPEFKVSYIGFVNGDTESSLIQKPLAECNATKSSNAGTYPIVVTGGEAENYNFLYQDGTLKINPLTVGFKDVYNSVPYNDMAISTSESYFNYIPEIIGPFSEEDFWIELWFLDKDNKYDQHVTTITGGDYAGNYVNTNVDRPMWAGKYIFNLISKGTNPNVTANPSRAYLTVNRASNNLEWNAESPISVKVGEKVDLGISYQANLWCIFNTDYNEDLIELSSEGATGNDPHWFATGLKEGETTLYFNIECKKNDMGFYDFTDSRTISKRIKVEISSGIDGVVSENNSILVKTQNETIIIINKTEQSVVRIFNLQGNLIRETSENEIGDLDHGVYVVTVDNQSFKIVI